MANLPTIEVGPVPSSFPIDVAQQQTLVETIARQTSPAVVYHQYQTFRPFFKFLMAKAKVREWAANFLEIPVTVPKDYSARVGTLDFAGNVTIPAVDVGEYQWARYQPVIKDIGITFSEPQIKLWKESPYRMIDDIKKQLMDTYKALFDTVSENLYTSGYDATLTPPAWNNTKFLGLQDVVDDGTTAPDFGGIDRSTYTWWSAFVVDATTLGVAAGSEYLIVRYAAAKYQKTIKEPHPTLAFCNFGTFEKLAASMLATLPTERVQYTTSYDQIASREAETTGIKIADVVFLVDPNIDEGTIYILDPEAIQFDFIEGYDVEMRPFVSLEPVGKFAFASWLLFGGQLYSQSPYRHIKITNVPYVTL